MLFSQRVADGRSLPATASGEPVQNGDLTGPLTLSRGARVCMSEADLDAAWRQAAHGAGEGPAIACHYAGADMEARFVRYGADAGYVLIELSGVSGEAWVMRAALHAEASRNRR